MLSKNVELSPDTARCDNHESLGRRFWDIHLHPGLGRPQRASEEHGVPVRESPHVRIPVSPTHHIEWREERIRVRIENGCRS